jgi:hypothetical protein
MRQCEQCDNQAEGFYNSHELCSEHLNEWIERKDE